MDYTVSRLMAAGNPTGVFTLADGLLNQSFYSNHDGKHMQLETACIAELLQNRQHAQNP